MQAPLKQFIYKVKLTAYDMLKSMHGINMLNNAMLSTGNNFYQV